jgi:hypothetical protein
LHAGDVGDAVVVEVGDHDVRERVVVAVDGEVDRLGVAKGAGGGVGPGVTVSATGELLAAASAVVA